MNPYAPPGAHDAAVMSMTGERAAQIQQRLKRLNALSFALGVPGILLQAVSQALTGLMATLVLLAGTGMLIGGLYFYASMRGRSGLFAFLGLLSCLGMLILYFLPKGCLNCGTSQASRAIRCNRCGGPLGS